MLARLKEDRVQNEAQLRGGQLVHPVLAGEEVEHERDADVGHGQERDQQLRVALVQHGGGFGALDGAVVVIEGGEVSAVDSVVLCAEGRRGHKEGGCRRARVPVRGLLVRLQLPPVFAQTAGVRHTPHPLHEVRVDAVAFLLRVPLPRLDSLHADELGLPRARVRKSLSVGVEEVLPVESYVAEAPDLGVVFEQHRGFGTVIDEQQVRVDRGIGDFAADHAKPLDEAAARVQVEVVLPVEDFVELLLHRRLEVVQNRRPRDGDLGRMHLHRLRLLPKRPDPDPKAP
mmetsp:Transcript_28960/g.69304  ORF Transcript_28960/g.69304 Transcript_28960/m.69304 type:complete len:286 (-) Transcript_28960:3-860(-)